MIILGCIFLIGGAIGIMMNFRMSAVRPNPLFAFGNALFFIGPIVLGIRTLSRTINDVDIFAIAFSGIGLFIMAAALLKRRRTN
jgi:uncharacterized membrane protein YhiD involved in acid resistance